MFRSHILSKLLKGKSDIDKERVKKIVDCIRFMHEKYELDYRNLNLIRLTLLKEFAKNE